MKNQYKLLKGERMNERQQLFCEYFLASANIAEAVRKAGYGSKNSGNYGYRIMEYPYIQDYLRLGMLERGRDMIDGCIDIMVALAECIEVDTGFREMVKYYREICKIHNVIFGKLEKINVLD